MPELDRGDAVLHYEVSGTGAPLMLVAGFMSDAASWAPLLPLLEPHFTLVRPDNRTCGQTRPWDAPVSMQHWADDLAALIDHLGTGPVPVVGHSLGGLIGWALATRAPEKVGRLLMMGSSPARDHRVEHVFASLIALRRSDAPKSAWLHALYPWLFRPEAFRDPRAVEAMTEAALAYPFAQTVAAMALQRACLSETEPAAFTRPQMPARALLSQGDLLVPASRARGHLDGFEIVEFEDLDHSMHWDDPERIAREIRDFLA